MADESLEVVECNYGLNDKSLDVKLTMVRENGNIIKYLYDQTPQLQI